MIGRLVKYIINMILYFIVVLIFSVIVGYVTYLIIRYGFGNALVDFIKNIGSK